MFVLILNNIRIPFLRGGEKRVFFGEKDCVKKILNGSCPLII